MWELSTQTRTWLSARAHVRSVAYSVWNKLADRGSGVVTA
jgi:hypothetical protein